MRKELLEKLNSIYKRIDFTTELKHTHEDIIKIYKMINSAKSQKDKALTELEIVKIAKRY